MKDMSDQSRVVKGSKKFSEDAISSEILKLPKNIVHATVQNTLLLSSFQSVIAIIWPKICSSSNEKTFLGFLQLALISYKFLTPLRAVFVLKEVNTATFTSLSLNKVARQDI
jgi:hypothetical protein